MPLQRVDLTDIFLPDRRRLGYYSSAMVYYAIAPGAFLSPVIVSKLGTQLTMGVGALTYTAVCTRRRNLICFKPCSEFSLCRTPAMLSTHCRSSRWSMDLCRQGG